MIDIFFFKCWLNMWPNFINMNMKILYMNMNNKNFMKMNWLGVEKQKEI